MGHHYGQYSEQIYRLSIPKVHSHFPQKDARLQVFLRNFYD